MMNDLSSMREIAVTPADMAGQMAVTLIIERPAIRAGSMADAEGIAPKAEFTDAKWQDGNLYVTLANGQRFQATFTEVNRFPFE